MYTPILLLSLWYTRLHHLPPPLNTNTRQRLHPCDPTLHSRDLPSFNTRNTHLQDRHPHDSHHHDSRTAALPFFQYKSRYTPTMVILYFQRCNMHSTIVSAAEYDHAAVYYG